MKKLLLFVLFFSVRNIDSEITDAFKKKLQVGPFRKKIEIIYINNFIPIINIQIVESAKKKTELNHKKVKNITEKN